MPGRPNAPENEVLHQVFSAAVLPRIKKDLLMHVGEVFDVVTQAHKPYGGAPQAYYYTALAQYFQRLGLEDSEAVPALRGWIERQALTAHEGEEGMTAPPVPTEAVEEWDEFRREERWRIFERLGKSPDDEVRRVLDHPLVGRLSLNDFAALAEALGDEVDLLRFITTWQALEEATQREVAVKEVVSDWIAEELAEVNNANNYEFFPPVETVDAARKRGHYFSQIAGLGEAFHIDKPKAVKLTPDQRQTYMQMCCEAGDAGD